MCVRLFSLAASRGDNNWPQFRGVNSAGVAQTQQIPQEFGVDKNLKWQLEMLPGHSSPCVWGDHLFLTSVDAENSTLETWSIHSNDGTIHWRKKIVVDKIEKGHPSFSPASSTPATDGARVVSYFGSYGLVCYDLEGEVLWEYRMPLAESFGGSASSPTIVGDKVVFGRFTKNDHFLMAVDKFTGEEICAKSWGDATVLLFRVPLRRSCWRTR